jgi:hypothetical protein
MYDRYFAKVEFLKSQWDDGLLTEHEYFQQLVVIGVEACSLSTEHIDENEENDEEACDCTLQPCPDHGG